MDRPDTFDAVTAGLRAAGWTLRPARYRGGVLASTEICHGGTSPDKLTIWPRPEGGFGAKCWTAGCEGRRLYDAIRCAAGIPDAPGGQNSHFRHFPTPGRPGDRPGPENAGNRAPGAPERPNRADSGARRLWADSAAIPAGPEHPARRWLAARSLWRPEFPAPGVLRWIAGAPQWAPWAAGCLAAPIAPVAAWRAAWPNLPAPSALARVAAGPDGGARRAADKRARPSSGHRRGPSRAASSGGRRDVCEGLARSSGAGATPGLLAHAGLAEAPPPGLTGNPACRGAARSGLAGSPATPPGDCGATPTPDGQRRRQTGRAALRLRGRWTGAGGGGGCALPDREGRRRRRQERRIPAAGRCLRRIWPSLAAMDRAPRWDTARRADIATRSGGQT